MGWAERLKKNKIPCGACGNERPCPHWHQEAGRMCDSCYRKLAATLSRLAGESEFTHKPFYGNVTFDDWTVDRW